MLINTACKKNDVPHTEQKELEAWYNQNKPISHVPFSELKPIWTSVYTSEQANDQSVYEIKLSNPKNVYQRLDGKFSKEDAVLRNNIRLLIFKDKSTGQIITGCYMSTINDADQLQDLNSLHYKQENRLSGKIMFFNMDGTLANGWGYKDGTITSRINGNIEGYYYGSRNNPANLNNPAIAKNVNSGMNKLMIYSPPSCAFPQPDYRQSCVGFEGYMSCTTYLAGYTCLEPSGGSGDGGGYNPYPGNGGGSGDGSNPNPSIPDVTNEFDDYPCAKALVVQMTTLNNDVARLIKNTFGVSDINNINFSPDSRLTGTTTDGRLNSQSGTSFQIGINPDILKNSTKEYILITFYHEALHAYFAQKLVVLGEAEFNRQFNGIGVNGGRLIAVVNEDHTTMGYDTFVRGLKDAIIAFNPNFGTSRAIALAQAGIIQLNASENQINEQERSASVGSTGTKCPK